MRISIGIASTTHLNRHNECMTKSALEGAADQIKSRYIPQLIEHDWNRHIGVILYGEVFQLKDSHYALGVVMGLFDSEEEKEIYKTGERNKVWGEYRKYLNIQELIHLTAKKRKDSPDKIRNTNYCPADPNLADLLETHLDSTQVLPNGTVYKIKRFITKTGDLSIEVYPKDHSPKHFHVISKQRGINARFDIQTLTLLNNKTGLIRESDATKIQQFFKTYPEMLKRLIDESDRLS